MLRFCPVAAADIFAAAAEVGLGVRLRLFAPEWSFLPPKKPDRVRLCPCIDICGMCMCGLCECEGEAAAAAAPVGDDDGDDEEGA